MRRMSRTWILPLVAATLLSCGGGGGGNTTGGPCAAYPLRQDAARAMRDSAAAAIAAAMEQEVAPQPAYTGPSLYSTSVFDVKNVTDRKETGLLIQSQAGLESYLAEIGFETLADEFHVTWESETLVAALLWPMQFVYVYGKSATGLTLYAGHLLPCGDYDQESLRLYYDPQVTFLKVPKTAGSAFAVVEMTDFFRFVRVEASGECARDPSGPVLDRVGGAPFVTSEAGRWRMWYGGYSAATGVILDTLSDDGVSWSPAGWDPAHTCTFEGHSPYTGHYGASVVPRPGGGYWMYYYDEDFNFEERGLVARAESDDGIRWSGEIAVLEPGAAGEWDDGRIASPSVVEQDGAYRMWYTGWRSGGMPGVGLAVSGDGATWERSPSNPVLGAGAAGTFDDLGVSTAEVRAAGGLLHMWYTASTGGGDWRYPQTSSIAHATSTDGVAWTRPAAPLLVAGSGFELKGIFDASAAPGDEGFILWYTAVNERYEPSIARAVCDGGR